MDRICQTSLRRTRLGPRLPRPLYPSHRHLKQPLVGLSGRQGNLPVERPQKTQPHRNDDSRCSRVHPPLPYACPSPGFRQAQILRLSRQPPPPQPTLTLSPAPECSTPGNRSPTPRLEIPPHSPDWRVPRYLSRLPSGPNAPRSDAGSSLETKIQPPADKHRRSDTLATRAMFHQRPFPMSVIMLRGGVRLKAENLSPRACLPRSRRSFPCKNHLDRIPPNLLKFSHRHKPD